MSLENAPDDVKLAVDLIELLESNNIAPEIVLSALEMVRSDYVNKLKASQDAS
ncbi:pleiotropic regulatory protein RsmS [Kluyvera sp. STS39-E]|uniref:pleiotropic regulatory protein RsmS n=1 Tax=Kluyvera sp. STS39-E TaxID=3234748 RepID=UPI0034C6A368